MFFQVLGHFMLDRRLQQLPGSFREQLFQVALGFIFGSLFERNHFSFHFRCILSFGASSESAVFFLVTERMRLSLSCHPQLSVIAPDKRVPEARLCTRSCSWNSSLTTPGGSPVRESRPPGSVRGHPAMDVPTATDPALM